MMPESAQRDIVLPSGGAGRDCLAENQLAQKWFAVYTSPRHEKRVSQYLGQKEIEHYLPLYRTQRKWRDGSKVTLNLPLFPGYLFVHIRKSERVPVLQVPGVLSLVGGTGRQPASLPEAEINALRSGLPLRRAEPHPLLTVGQRARIRSGALAGKEGVLVRRKNSLRVVLTMELIQRSVAVEVDESELETLSSEGPGSVLIKGHS
ncbi:MAG TPA: UpxY family transcription antiterminator [Terracidiphilus sp.]|jgi:transcription antitermination factor NusG